MCRFAAARALFVVTTLEYVLRFLCLFLLREK